MCFDLDEECPDFGQELESHVRAEPTADQLRLVQTVQELVHAGNWRSLSAMADELLLTARYLRSAKPEWAGAIFH